MAGMIAATLAAAAFAQEARVRAAPRVEMPQAIDSNSPAFWHNGRLVWYGSHGGPVASEGPGQFGPWQARDVWVDAPNTRGAKWIEAVVPQDERTLWAWYHMEPSGLVPGSTLTAPSIGALLSLDGGLTFADLGIVLESGDLLNPRAENGYFAGGHGDFSVVLDREQRYFYFFFGNYGGPTETQGVAMARMAFGDRANPIGKVWKYRNGSWQEAGLGGAVTPIFPVKRSWAVRDPDAFWGPAVHWNTHLNCYVMLLNRAQGEPGWAQEGIYVSFSSDLSRPESWSTPVKVLDKAAFPDWYFFYPQVMGLEPGDTDRRAGRVARLYVGGISKWEIEFTAAPTPPASVQIAAISGAGTRAAGESITLSVAPTGAAPFTYQWFKDGVALSFGTRPELELANLGVGDAGSYHVVVANTLGAVASAPFVVTVAAAPDAPPAVAPAPPAEAFLANLSVRAALTEADGMSVGFVIQGERPKPLVVRAIGPTLGFFGVADAAANPSLQVFNHAREQVAENGDWLEGDAETFAAVGAFALPRGSADAALAVEAGAGGGTASVTVDRPGVVLAEIYDPAPARDSKIVNLSARAVVDNGARLLIGGFSVSNSGSKRVLVRALGPQLTAYGVASVAARPVIEVFDDSGALLATNDGWKPEHAAEFAAAGATSLPDGSADAAVVVTLDAGRTYTSVVRNGDATAGEALLELYVLPDAVP